MSEVLDPDAPIDDPGMAVIERPPADGEGRRGRWRDRVDWRELPARAGRRVVRRPLRWWNAPWTPERIVQQITALVLVGGCTYVVLRIVHPDLVLDANTPTGGDMGAHVLGPAYLRDSLLPKFQLTGWSNDWYAGMPWYRFYMVLPALMIVALNAIGLHYGVAFKIVAVAGLLSLPFCCWAFGRLARFRYPMPELMAVGGLLFLLDETFSIYGGNVKSTMAGEFSFSIALSFAILGLGLFCRGLETGQYRSWTAIVIAMAMLSHGIVLLFVLGAAFLLWLVWMDFSRLVYGACVLVGAVLLSAFWVLPFILNHQYMTDMKYGGRPDGAADSYWDMFFQYSPFWDLVVGGLAVVGFVASVVRRNLAGAWLGITCLALMAATFLARDSLPMIGLLWNPRILPFLYLMRLLLMMVGIVEIVHYIVRSQLRVRELGARAVAISGAAVAGVVALVALIVQLFAYQVPKPGTGISLGGFGRVEAQSVQRNNQNFYTWSFLGWQPISVGPNPQVSVADGWTKYNFQGYEGRPYYGEYYSVVQQMDALGADARYGCGRAMWENNSANGNYGTTMALMLLPFWTDGCIASMEGLFFEASGTTPYHFVAAAAISQSSSNPVRGLRYDNNDADKGVPYLQALGVKYLMVQTQAAKDEADAQADLTLVATVGPWNIYTVAGSELVVPLDVQPVVVRERSGDQRERHLELGMSWFQHRDEWAAIPADSGPAGWQRIDAVVDVARSDGLDEGDGAHKVDILVPGDTITPVALPEVNVSNVVLGEQDLEFDVDRVGVPVLVKMSYFPNWDVDGAEGPYRVAPNFMVVVPTSTHVRLHYDRSLLDYAAYFLSLLGIGMLILFRRLGDVRHANAHPFDAGHRPVSLLPDYAAPAARRAWPRGDDPPIPPVYWMPDPPVAPGAAAGQATLDETVPMTTPDLFDLDLGPPVGPPAGTPPERGAPGVAAPGSDVAAAGDDGGSGGDLRPGSVGPPDSV